MGPGDADPGLAVVEVKSVGSLTPSFQRQKSKSKRRFFFDSLERGCKNEQQEFIKTDATSA